MAGEVEKGGGGVVAVDLVEKAAPVFFNDGASLKEALQDDAAARSVDAGEAGYRSACTENEGLDSEERRVGKEWRSRWSAVH